MRKIYMMIAPPASGKTTFVKDNLSAMIPHRVISRDDIRDEIIGDKQWSRELERSVLLNFKIDIMEAIQAEVPEIFIDATHTVPQRRRDIISFLHSLPEYKKHNYQLEAVVVVATREECIERNSKRDDKTRVPEARLHKFFDGFQKPEFSEGFDSIAYVRGKQDGVDSIRYHWSYVGRQTTVD